MNVELNWGAFALLESVTSRLEVFKFKLTTFVFQAGTYIFGVRPRFLENFLIGGAIVENWFSVDILDTCGSNLIFSKIIDLSLEVVGM